MDIFETAEANEIASLHRAQLASLGCVYSLADIVSKWSAGVQATFIVARLSHPVGFAAYRKMAKHIYISDLYVDVDKRRGGVAERILLYIPAQGHPTELEVDIDNHPARRLYQKLHFGACGLSTENKI